MKDLDYRFLRYIGVTREGQRRIQAFYLPFFEDCHRVVDLGCGEGHFVEMLAERGLEAVGVDRDEECCREASQRGIKVVCQDVFDYLRVMEEGAVDGIFSSHLVEHLPYQEVLELLSLCYQALAPGGAIVLTTPNVRGLFSHLEMFYMHFGHVTFYHPNLLCFLLQYRGFSNPVAGENPSLASPLLGDFRLQSLELGWGENGGGASQRWLRRARTFLAKAVAGPCLEGLAAQANRNFQRVNDLLNILDRSFECYVKSTR